MKKTIIMGMATAVISMTALTVSATSDTQYPAANFEPKVIYIDKTAVKTTSKASCKKTSAEADKTEFDPKYPAAHFKPKVIYP
jgi:predicted homoserine dehydrogenase-like protein